MWWHLKVKLRKTAYKKNEIKESKVKIYHFSVSAVCEVRRVASKQNDKTPLLTKRKPSRLMGVSCFHTFFYLVWQLTFAFPTQKIYTFLKTADIFFETFKITPWIMIWKQCIWLILWWKHIFTVKKWKVKMFVFESKRNSFLRIKYFPCQITKSIRILFLYRIFSHFKRKCFGHKFFLGGWYQRW